MTRYGPYTVTIMQHWSKWPFHTEELRKNQSSTSFSRFFSFCFTIPCIHKFHCSLHVCLYNIYQAKCCLSNQLTPAQKAISSCSTRIILLFTSMLYFSLCLFVFASYLCPLRRSLPLLPARLASSAAGHPSHVKSQRLRQVTKKRPDFSAHQSGRQGWNHHNG